MTRSRWVPGMGSMSPCRRDRRRSQVILAAVSDWTGTPSGGATWRAGHGGEAVGQKSEHDHGAEKGMHPRVGESQGRSTLAADDGGLADLAEGDVADGRVVADSLDVEETSVGSEADLPESGRFSSRLPIPKSRVSSTVVSVRRATPSL